MILNFYIEDKKKLQKELQSMNARIKDLSFYRSHIFKDGNGEIIDIIGSDQKVDQLRNKVSKTLLVMEYYLQEWNISEQGVDVSIQSYPFTEILCVSGDNEKVQEFARKLQGLKSAPISKSDLFTEFCNETGCGSRAEVLFSNYN